MSACALTLGTGFYVALHKDINFLKKDYINLTRIEAKLIGEFSISALIEESNKGAREILEKASSSITEFKSVEVYNENGDLFTQLGNITVKPPQHIRLISDTAIYYKDKHELKVSHVITSEGHTFGYIIIHVSTLNLENHIWQDKKSLFLAAVAIIILGGIITLFAQKAVSQPIFKLTKYINHVADQNNITKTIKTSRNDEIGQIYKAINKLISTIRQHANERGEFFAEIEKNNIKLGHTLESFSDGYWEYNLETSNWFFSDRWLSTFGYKREVMRTDNKSFTDMIHPSDIDTYSLALKDHLKGKKGFFETEFRLLDKKGDYSWVSFKGKEVERKNNKAVLILGITTSIQEKREYEREIKGITDNLVQEKKLTALNSTVGGISHSLKNILNPIFGYADMGLQTTQNNLLKDELHLIKNAAGEANELIEDLLASSVNTHLEKEKINLLPVIKECASQVKINFETTELILESDLKQAVVLGNKKQLEKAILNIVENAFIASPMGENVTIKIDYFSKEYSEGKLKNQHKIPSEEYLQITVSDKGIGIEKDSISNIFEPFYTTRAVGEGRGLGLSVAKGIISSHQGFIFISSEPYEGTSCVLLIPVLK